MPAALCWSAPAPAHIVITLGQHGLTLYSASSPSTPHHVPPREVEVYDSAGAGDTVISAMTMALVAGASAADAVTLANYAAAEAVKKLGVSTGDARRDFGGVLGSCPGRPTPALRATPPAAGRVCKSY